MAYLDDRERLSKVYSIFPSVRRIGNEIYGVYTCSIYDDLLVRKTIEFIKVYSKTKLQMIFKGGYEVYADIENSIYYLHL